MLILLCPRDELMVVSYWVYDEVFKNIDLTLVMIDNVVANNNIRERTS